MPAPLSLDRVFPWVPLTLLGSVMWFQAAPETPSPARPNVVLIYADDMGWGDLGVQNPESKIPTPNLDRLAARGMRFTDAHSSSGICTPSRFALLTGMHHWRRFHEIVNAFGPSVFVPEDLTMAEMFRESGYETACIGKWHLGWEWGALRREGASPVKGVGYAPEDFDWSQRIPDGPLAHGFDHYFGDDVPNFPPYGWIRDDRMVVAPTVPLKVSPRPTEGSAESRPGPMVEGWRQDMVMPRLTARVVEWLSEPARKERPFFLYFPWTSPHAPITPAGEFRGTTNAGGYGDFLHQSDAHLGEVLKALQDRGLTENTLIVFTSDNGPEAYAYERTRAVNHKSMGPLRGVKRDVFEGGHRIPFIVSWPGRIEPGTVSSALISQVDLFRTFAKILNHTLPEGAARDSLNQLSVWESKTSSIRHHHVHNTYAGVWALRKDNWLYLNAAKGTHNRIPSWYATQESLQPSPEGAWLFDLSQDLPQRTNLLNTHPTLAKTLAKELESHRAN